MMLRNCLPQCCWYTVVPIGVGRASYILREYLLTKGSGTAHTAPAVPTASPQTDFRLNKPQALARDVFRFAVWLFLNCLGVNIGRRYSCIHSKL